MTDFLHDKDELTLVQLKSTMRKLKKHERHGFYLVVEELWHDATGRPKFSVELWGPKLRWNRKIKEEWELSVAN